MNNKSTLLLVLITGAAFGAALGMLLTPHSGAVNRRILRRKSGALADEMIETIKEPIEQLSDSITENFETLKKNLISRFGS